MIYPLPCLDLLCYHSRALGLSCVVLSCQDNAIGDDGVIAMTEALMRNGRLRTVCLDGNMVRHNPLYGCFATINLSTPSAYGTDRATFCGVPR